MTVVWNFCRWGADVLPGKTSLAERSKEKRPFLLLSSYSIQVPRCTLTRSANQDKPCFHTKSWPVLLESCFQGQRREVRTISYLSVSARIENTVRYWTSQTLRILLTLSHLRAFTMMLSGKLFSRWSITKYNLLNGTDYYLLDREFWVGTEKHPARWEGEVRKNSNLRNSVYSHFYANP